MLLLDRRMTTLPLSPVLQISNLTVSYRQEQNWLDAVRMLIAD